VTLLTDLLRKKILLGSACLLVAGNTFYVRATAKTVWLLIFGRLLCGFGAGNAIIGFVYVCFVDLVYCLFFSTSFSL